MNEHSIQVSCVQWFAWQYPKYDKIFFAIPNGGKRDGIIGKKIKEEGGKRGVPDLFLSCARKVDGILYYGLYIEMKTEKKSSRLSKVQKEFFEKAREEGYMCVVCRSLDDFISIINKYLKNETSINSVNRS